MVGVTGGSTVTQWDDQSGNARHLTPGAAGSPSSGTRTLNGLNVIDFDGTNDGLGKTGSIGFGMTNWTVFWVGGADADTNSKGLMSIYDSVTDWNSAAGFAWTIGTNVRDVQLDMNGVSVFNTSSGNLPPKVWAARKNGTSVILYRNGTAIGRRPIFERVLW